MTFLTTLRLGLIVLLATFGAQASFAQSLQEVLGPHQAAVEKASRKTIDPVLDALIASALPEVPEFLERWQSKDVWMRKEDKAFFYVTTEDKKTYELLDLSTKEAAGSAAKSDLKQLKPNSGVRAILATALVQFQLSDPNPNRRLAALQSIERDPAADQLEALENSIEGEDDPAIRERKTTLARLLTARFGASSDARVSAINELSNSLSVETRAALNPILATRRVVTQAPPEDLNVAVRLEPGTAAFPVEMAYELLVASDQAPPRLTRDLRDAALVEHIENGKVVGIEVAALNTEPARDQAYGALASAGLVPGRLSAEAIDETLAAFQFYDVYQDPDTAVTQAAEAALATIETRVQTYTMLDLTLDGMSLASIYFLAAIGLAITFGVMRVINMAHGEFIMMGAYTGYVVQLFITDYTWSLVVALPLAFAVTFAAGVALERLVIRHLYSRPLETLLATFGVSIALQQLAKNIFGTQARPLTAPGWLDGAWVMNDVVSISYIRIAIFVLGLIFLALLLIILNRTRLGLEVRAVTQNPRMAASMGINPDRINMLTFGLGSGIAGIAGVAIGLYAKVTSELGAAYIVQSFMTVVVGGVGNIWGTLLGATMIGNLQKLIEWFNPSNTLAAQTYMILFIILFIQFRPRGIIALKGRAAGD
ncbi:MAG: urea ABC transporter permease subunit UrtB [Pseudomonadota bacterium]